MERWPVALDSSRQPLRAPLGAEWGARIVPSRTLCVLLRHLLWRSGVLTCALAFLLLRPKGLSQAGDEARDQGPRAHAGTPNGPTGPPILGPGTPNLSQAGDEARGQTGARQGPRGGHTGLPNLDLGTHDFI